MSFSKMDIPKKIMSLGMSYADAIKKKLDNNEDVNTTDVIMTSDMGITLTKIILIDCSVDVLSCVSLCTNLRCVP